ncbi:hypothetical protein HNQ02_003766 [Flavobacterium sp. 7E]|nr:hypothetical protein [Flavobacterium sp. 7E]
MCLYKILKAEVLKLEFANRNFKNFSVKIVLRKNNQPITAVTRYLGIWLNLKMVLYLEN